MALASSKNTHATKAFMSMVPITSFDAATLEARSEALSTTELCEALEELVKTARLTEWLSCRHLAELADRFERHDPELGSYTDIYQWAHLRFDIGVRRTRERVR